MRLILIQIILLSFLSVKAELGIATYYSDAFHGSGTASGELYDKNKLTAAHKTLPFGSKVRVTRLDNNKSVVVTINDRGPYIKGYVIEVSSKAANQLAITDIDGAKVKIELIEKGEFKKPKEEEVAVGKLKTNPKVPELEVVLEQPNKETPKNETLKKEDEFTAKTGTPVKDYDITKPIVKKEKPKKPKKEVSKKKEEQVEPKVKKVLTKINKEGFEVYDLYKPVAKKTESLGFGVKVASYQNFENVLKQVAILQENWFSEVYMVVEKYINEPITYKIIMESFEDIESAAHYAKDVNKKGMSAYVVDMSKEVEPIYYFRALRPDKSGFGVQIGVVSKEEVVLEEILKYEKKWLNNILISVEKGADDKPIYKFILGPFPDMPTAQSYKKHSKEKGLEGFVVSLADIKY